MLAGWQVGRLASWQAGHVDGWMMTMSAVVGELEMLVGSAWKSQPSDGQEFQIGLLTNH